MILPKKTLIWQFQTELGSLYKAGLRPDGSLYNPNNYPEDIVRPLVMGVYGRGEARKKQRRAEGARKSGATRKRRAEKKLYEIVDRIVAGHTYGPAHTCALCDKDLSDPQSIERGIGSDCWQRVLATIELRQCRETA